VSDEGQGAASVGSEVTGERKAPRRRQPTKNGTESEREVSFDMGDPELPPQGHRLNPDSVLPRIKIALVSIGEER